MKPASSLTVRQKEILDYIISEVETKGFPPSVREIGQEFGLSSSSTVQSHLRILEKKGFIKRHASKPRSIEVLNKINRLKVRHIPILNSIIKGQPVFSSENIVGLYPLPEDFSSSPKLFMVLMEADSLNDVGILKDDYIVVSYEDNFVEDDIVVRIVDSRWEIGKFKKENPNSWLGKAVGIIRKF